MAIFILRKRYALDMTERCHMTKMEGPERELRGRGPRLNPVFVAQGQAQQADQQRSQRRHNGQHQALARAQLRRGGIGGRTGGLRAQC